MNYKTCVSVAETTPKKVKKTLDLALQKSDYAEIRFDYLKPEYVPETLQIIKKHMKRLVCTLRPKSEGGKFSGSEKERIAILKLIAEYSPCLLDIEFNTLKKDRKLFSYIKKTHTEILVSWHDFRKTPRFSELKKKLQDMKKLSLNVKIVTTAKSLNDSTRVLQLYSKSGNASLIAFAMGDHGRLSRILSLYLGSPYTYVSLGKPIAPGQFSVDEVKKITRTNKRS